MNSALVLSAGGMFGAYQAGAWRYLAGRFRPDLVVGASVGALNGWTIAGGITPDELAAVWRDPRLAQVGRLARRLAAGVLDAGPLATLIRELATRYTPRVPFGLTVVEVPRLRLRLLKTPGITWEHLLAACAVPAVFPPVRIGGRLCVDGGLLGALPLWAADEMGAEEVVAVDVLPAMPSRVLRASVRLAQRLAPPPPPARARLVARIAHDRPLGSVRDALYWNRDRAERWMEWGAADAARCFRLE